MKRPLNLVICLLIPFVIFVAGLVFGAVRVVKALPELTAEAARGVMPGVIEFSIAEPGRYTVWLHTVTNFEGKAYEHEDRLPAGGEVLIYNKESGSALDLYQGLNATKTINRDSAVAIGAFETAQPNQVLEIRSSGISDPLVVSVAPGKMRDVFGLVMQALGILCITLLVAIVTLILLLHRRQKQLRELSEVV